MARSDACSAHLRQQARFCPVARLLVSYMSLAAESQTQKGLRTQIYRQLLHRNTVWVRYLCSSSRHRLWEPARRPARRHSLRESPWRQWRKNRRGAVCRRLTLHNTRS